MKANKFDAGKARLELLPTELWWLVQSEEYTPILEAVIELADWSEKESDACLRDVYKLILDELGCTPIESITMIANIMEFGAGKYGDHNWRAGMKWSRLIGAAMRHMVSHAQGNLLDAETCKPHLWHALCCVMFLITYDTKRLGEDDRYVT